MEAMDNLNVKGLMVRNSNVLLHRMALYGAVCEVDFKELKKKWHDSPWKSWAAAQLHSELKAAKSSQNWNVRISQRFELRGRFQGCFKSFGFLPSICVLDQFGEILWFRFVFRDDSLLAFCQKPLNHAYTCLLHPHEEKPLQEQPKRYLSFYHTTGHGQVLPLHGGITQTKTKTEQTEYLWHFPCHWARALAQFQWTSMTMSNIDDDQRGREAANEARRWSVKWPQWPVHSASSPQTKIPLMESLEILEIHREFSVKTGEKKHKQFGKQSCVAKLDDTFVYMILLFMWNWKCVMIWPQNHPSIHPKPVGFLSPRCWGCASCLHPNAQGPPRNCRGLVCWWLFRGPKFHSNLKCLHGPI